MDYVDLYLVHWPIPDKIVDTWRALETIHTDGRARSIGVSNFLETHLDDLLASATVSPTVNQIEFHPHLQPGDLITYCVDREIQVVAWSPLVRGEALAINEINQIGERYQKTAAQVVLRWQLQRGIVTIPKSVKREHIQANADIFDFELSASEMVTMNGLNRNRRTGPDPTHPPS